MADEHNKLTGRARKFVEDANLARLKAEEKLARSTKRVAALTGRRETTVQGAMGAAAGIGVSGGIQVAKRYMPRALAKPGGVPIDAFVAVFAGLAAATLDKKVGVEGVQICFGIATASAAVATAELVQSAPLPGTQPVVGGFEPFPGFEQVANETDGMPEAA